MTHCTFRFTTISLLISCLTAGSLAQSPPSDNPPRVSPESGFVSTSKYTNEFFGFSLPLPKTSGFPSVSEFKQSFQGDSSRDFLFGLQSLSTNYVGSKVRLTLLTVAAERSASNSQDEARKAASGPKGRTVTQINIDGKEFWKSELQEKSPEGKIRSVVYATALNGYVLRFDIGSFDWKLAGQLQHCVEAITFFDPLKAKEMAGSDSLMYRPAVSQSASSAGIPPGSRIRLLNEGVISGNTYTNDALGFEYELPAAWVINDKATLESTMKTGHQFADGYTRSAARGHELFEECARVLLFVTKHPEGAKIEELNPLVYVIAADPACFPNAQFPASVIDRDGMRQAVRQLMGSFAGTPFVAKWEDSSVNASAVQGHLMLDVSGSLAVDSLSRKLPLNVFTSCVFTETKGYWVAWGFESGSLEGLRKLKNARLVLFHPHR